MHLTMNDNTIHSVEQLEQLIDTAHLLGENQVLRNNTTEETYLWMTDLLLRLKYRFLKKKEKGIIREYLTLYSGYTLSHLDHLIAQLKKEGRLAKKERTQPTYERTYTNGDIELLAEVAEAYEHQNGRSLKEVCREMFQVFNDDRFERLSRISTSHLYTLKKTPFFKNTALTYTKTKPSSTNIGERKKPYPEGKPGYLRVDSVHQGDKDKEKGVYHIHLIDEVVQWDINVAVEGISEQYMKSALLSAFDQFPFEIINFHSDNGSEYINSVVAGLLEKLLITQTKSRSRKTNDNALAEGKHAAVTRKYMGRMHIQKKHAESISEFYKEFLNPFVNYHRFCFFPTEVVDSRGKIRKLYTESKTPVQKLLSLPDCGQYLKEGETVEGLLARSQEETHLACAKRMQEAKRILFKKF
jgi:hypothetical protein